VLTSPGNFDADPAPEFAVVVASYSGQTELRLIDSLMAHVIWSRAVDAIRRGGPPVISDLDGNGIPDISFIGMYRHVAYTSNGDLLWSNVTQR
jgi:hypothetical protein